MVALLIRVDHSANYHRPKSDEKDEHGNYKEIIELGCAPQDTVTDLLPASEEEEKDIFKLPKKRKKKEKNAKKHKEEKSLKEKKQTAILNEEEIGEIIIKTKHDSFIKD